MQKRAKRRQTLAEIEADYIEETLEFARGNKAEAARDHLLLRLPNLPHSSVAIGKTAADNPVVQVWGERPKFSSSMG